MHVYVFLFAACVPDFYWRPPPSALMEFDIHIQSSSASPQSCYPPFLSTDPLEVNCPLMTLGNNSGPTPKLACNWVLPFSSNNRYQWEHTSLVQISRAGLQMSSLPNTEKTRHAAEDVLFCVASQICFKSFLTLETPLTELTKQCRLKVKLANIITWRGVHQWVEFGCI